MPNMLLARLSTPTPKLAVNGVNNTRRVLRGKLNKGPCSVTNPIDSCWRCDPLRHAVIQPVPVWITFARSMIIRLSEELLVTSDKTIDGRGANVHISGGAQITLQFVRNVIIHGMCVHDSKRGNGGMIRDTTSHYGYRTQSDGDGISLFGATNVWIDHISMWNCYDRLIDGVMASTAITVSNCHFTRHNDVILFGASDW
ncbi:hypothetical protein L6164_014610 [Bauhinia variegata]|uniref:Uncharacterized protein n=1 Tax=Bauhinia variegata TaxID=167791 RepID=A0ACB9NJW9_BAUVA|nr:hypothetical protein L6164_014610 [Bauhinia variegata]